MNDWLSSLFKTLVVGPTADTGVTETTSNTHQPTVSSTDPPTAPKCPLTSSLPAEIHLLILSYLPRIAQYELSLTCKFLHSRWPVHLTKGETIELRLQTASQKSGGHHEVCSGCVHVLPFYHFADFQLKFIKGQGNPRRPSMCLPCQESRMIKGSYSLYGAPLKWSFGEYVAVCPSCLRFVRCVKGENWDDEEDREFDDGFEFGRYMFAHGECAFPERTRVQAVDFMKASEEARDRLPLLAEKIAHLERRTEAFPTSVLGAQAERPLKDFVGLLP